MDRLFRCLIVAGVVLTSIPAMAGNLYRYTDDDGTVVLDRTIPPEFVSRGYTVLDEMGNILKVVEPALTPEERTRQKEAERRAELQKARDQELLKLYRSSSDVERAMAAWMSRLDVEIHLKRNQMAIKQSEYNEYQSQAADLERVGKPVTQEILDEMALIQTEIDRIQLSIDSIDQRKKEDRVMFELDKKRVIELTSPNTTP